MVPDQRLLPVATVGKLVAVAADDQQRVVDGQRQAHRGAQLSAKIDTSAV